MRNTIFAFLTKETLMQVTVTEFRKHISRYLLLSNREDIMLTKRGKPIAVVVGLYRENLKALESIFGILSSDVDEKE